MTQQLLRDDPESLLIQELDISHLMIEDGLPVDNFKSERQQRLLVNALYSAKVLSFPFLGAANVGLFYQINLPPIVPDMMLSLGVELAEDLSQKKNLSYFVWEFGKFPEVCIEIVSNQEGDEVELSRKSRQKGKTQSKREIYDRIGIQHYVVFDPFQYLEREMEGSIVQVWSKSNAMTVAQSMAELGQVIWLETVGLGLTLWEGRFEGSIVQTWLRWCDRDGNVLLTGDERTQAAETKVQIAETKVQIAETKVQVAEAKAQKLAEQLRALGIEPDDP